MNGCWKAITSRGGPVTMTFWSASTAMRVRQLEQRVQVVRDHDHGELQVAVQRAQQRDEAVRQLSGSSPAVGSSSSSSGGSMISARASATRLIMPPDRSDGILFASLGLEADHLQLDQRGVADQRGGQRA